MVIGMLQSSNVINEDTSNSFVHVKLTARIEKEQGKLIQ